MHKIQALHDQIWKLKLNLTKLFQKEIQTENKEQKSVKTTQYYTAPIRWCRLVYYFIFCTTVNWQQDFGIGSGFRTPNFPKAASKQEGPKKVGVPDKKAVFFLKNLSIFCQMTSIKLSNFNLSLAIWSEDGDIVYFYI